MRENTLRRKLQSREAVVGVISPSLDPGIAEMMGLSGLDFYMIDAEHGAIGPAQAGNIVRACEATRVVPLARIRGIDEKLILQFMDVGVMGVMMPGILNAEDVRKLVGAVKYPPLGRRGLGPVRAADYFLGSMSQAEYVASANHETLVLPQIEDIEAVRNIDSMLQVNGVDGFIFGPRDLAMSMGHYDGPQHDDVQACIADVTKRVLRAGLNIGTLARTGGAARALIEQGMSIILYSLDVLISSQVDAFLREARSNQKVS